MDLDAIETCYDLIPRAHARAEEIGPFSLFLPAGEEDPPLYARPRLGLRAEVTAQDVRRVLARQAELGVPRAIEWVHEVTPSLLPAVRAAVPADHEPRLCPLLALPEDAVPAVPAASTGPAASTRVLTGDEPDLPLALGAVSAAFRGHDDVVPKRRTDTPRGSPRDCWSSSRPTMPQVPWWAAGPPHPEGRSPS